MELQEQIHRAITQSATLQAEKIETVGTLETCIAVLRDAPWDLEQVEAVRSELENLLEKLGRR